MESKFLTNLPLKKGFGANLNKEIIDWYATINTDILILYNCKKYTLHINSYTSKKGLLNITFKELSITKDIYVSTMRSLSFSNIIPKESTISNVNWRYKINEVISDERRYLTILEYILKQDKNNHNLKYYRYKCLTCGNVDIMSEKSLNKKANCSVCSNKKVVVGINDIATTHPNLCKFFANPTDCKTLSIGTRTKVEVICPICGYEKDKKMYPKTLLSNGIACPKCGDGTSYPEKFCLSLLEQANIRFAYQISPNWANNKFKYDFYLLDYNCIIEVHGLQHYETGFNIKNSKKAIRTLQEEQANDLFKEYLANTNNINHYIIIDARESCSNFIKNNILNSQLVNLLDLTNIDWDKCAFDAMQSRVKIACDFYNKGFTIAHICKLLKSSRTTVRKYLSKGSKISFCNYNPNNSIKESFKRPNKRNPTKSVVCLETKEIYNSINEAASVTGSNPVNIGNCCKGKRKTSGGYHWMYKSDYEKSSLAEINSITNKLPFIINLDTLETFYSIKEAQEFYNSKGNITLCCQGKYLTACGYRWMYYKNYILSQTSK